MVLVALPYPCKPCDGADELSELHALGYFDPVSFDSLGELNVTDSADSLWSFCPLTPSSPRRGYL